MYREICFICSGRIRWDESVAALTLLPASVLFGRVTSSLKFEVSLLGRINQDGSSSCVFKLEHALLVHTCDVFETAYPGSLVSKASK